MASHLDNSCLSPTWTVSPIRYDDPSVQPLLLQLHVAQVQMYGFADDPADTPADGYTPPDGLFLLGRDASGQAAGCGGWRLLGPRTAEIKRMYVCPDARGKSLGRQILLRLEADAQLRGVAPMQLETGVANLAALRLYHLHGYQPIEPYRPGRNPAVNRALRRTLQGTLAP
jgi:GNAT superfamily N-acetyltransferase